MLTLTSLGLLAGGGVLRLADGALRDDGYVTTGDVRLASPGYAVYSESIELEDGPALLDLPQRWLGDVRVRAVARTDNGVFVGVGRTDEVLAYLEGVAASRLVSAYGDDDPSYVFTDGGSPRRAPTDETFWVASAAGTGVQEVVWAPEGGDWTVVVMNGEGTTPVDAEVEAGATLPVLDDVGLAMLVSGGVLLLISVLLFVLGLRRPSVR